MAKMKSSLLNMVLSLGLISICAAALLGGVYTITKDPIAATEKATQAQAKLDVLPIEGVEVAEEAVENGGINIYPATLNGEKAGAAVEVKENGFGGEFTVMVGFDAEGTVIGYKVLAHQETPGLGSKMQEWFSNTAKPQACVNGKNPGKANFIVSKDGGDIDAITAATISSRAFLLAVTKAYNAYMEGGNDGMTGATKKAEHKCCEGACEHQCNHEGCGEGQCEHHCEHACCHANVESAN